ncbi:MAG: hypothetical protein ABFS22_10980 [Pseudomonadota bacterium]
MPLPRLSINFEDASEPLSKRAPLYDENGKSLSDFMVLVPGLKEKPQNLINNTINEIHLVLSRFQDVVVFAEFNIKLNLLWVSIRPLPGIRFEIAGAIQERVPEARLVSHI